jgi:hypothetical protein
MKEIRMSELPPKTQEALRDILETVIKEREGDHAFSAKAKAAAMCGSLDGVTEAIKDNGTLQSAVPERTEALLEIYRSASAFCRTYIELEESDRERRESAN